MASVPLSNIQFCGEKLVAIPIELPLKFIFIPFRRDAKRFSETAQTTWWFPLNRNKGIKYFRIPALTEM